MLEGTTAVCRKYRTLPVNGQLGGYAAIHCMSTGMRSRLDRILHSSSILGTPNTDGIIDVCAFF